MTDPNRIQGPTGPSEPVTPKKDRTVGADDFKKYMVEEVKETDAEQKGRKRKRREQGEEETESEKKAIGAAPQKPATAPLGKIEEAPLKVKSKAAPPPLPPSPGRPSITSGITSATPAFRPDEIEKFAWEDEAKRMLSSPAVPQAAAAAAAEEGPPPSVESYEGLGWEGYVQPDIEQPAVAQPPAQPPAQTQSAAEKKEARKKVHEPTPTAPEEELPKKGARKKPVESTKLLAKEGKGKKGPSEEFKTLMEEPKAPEEKKKVTPEKVESEAARMAAPLGSKAEAEASHALPSTKKEVTGKILPRKPGERKEEEEIEKEIPAGMMPLATGAAAAGGGGGGETGKERKPKEGREYLGPPVAGQMEGMPTVFAPGPSAPLVSVSPYAELHPEILSLFERLIGVVTVMKTAGITETTLFLSEKAFAGTVLSGTSITISEYKFAAGELNLAFSGSPQAIALLQQQLPSLTAALSRSGLVVKRSDFIFSRKEAAGGRGGKENKGERGPR